MSEGSAGDYDPGMVDPGSRPLDFRPFDADNHYYEAEDAFIRHIDPAMAKDADGATAHTITLSSTFSPQREPSRPVAVSAPATRPGSI